MLWNHSSYCLCPLTSADWLLLLSNLLSIVCRDSLSTKENAQSKQRVGWKIKSSAYKKMSMFDNKLQLTASCWILNLILVSSATGIQDAYVKGTRLWKWIQENNLFWKLCSIYYNNLSKIIYKFFFLYLFSKALTFFQLAFCPPSLKNLMVDLHNVQRFKFSAYKSRACHKNINFQFLLSLTEIIAQNVRYYEAIDYDATDVHKQHLEVLNSSKNSAVAINFWAFQRYHIAILTK